MKDLRDLKASLLLRFVDIETLKGVFQSLGFGDITPEDVTVLVETADSGKLYIYRCIDR